MLDFNDAPPQRDDRPKLYDIEALKRGLAERAPDLIPQLFPRGRISSNGREWRTANTRGDPPKKDGSCVFTLTGPFAGYHQDWSTGEEGDQLATLGLVTGLAGRELFEHATEIIGTKAKSNGTSRCEPAKVDRTLDAQFTLRLCGLAVDTPVETYLNSRGLDLPPCDDIKFHPSLTDYDAKLGRPGMVAIVRDPETGKRLGIHRTYLADDGAAKADMAKPKMMLGPCGGGVVMLLPMTDDGVLGIGEGIETSLSGATIFGVPAWAALSDSGVRNFVFPPGLKRMFIFADRGNTGENAATALCRRALQAGVEALMYLPKSDDDFK